MATVVRFQAKPSQLFAIFDSLVAITTHPGAQNSRLGSFGADNDNTGQTDKPIALPRFAHARGVIILLLRLSSLNATPLHCTTVAVHSHMKPYDFLMLVSFFYV